MPNDNQTTSESPSCDAACSPLSDFEKGPWSYDLYADGLEPVALLNNHNHSQGEWVTIAQYRKAECERDEWRNAEAATNRCFVRDHQQLLKLTEAIRNLRDVKGRHHTQMAMENLIALLPENVIVYPPAISQRTPLHGKGGDK